jgi:hypothetical protein
MGADVRLVDWQQNRAQGRKLGGIDPKAFHNECMLTTSVSFLVVPVIVPGVPTTNMCRP